MDFSGLTISSMPGEPLSQGTAEPLGIPAAREGQAARAGSGATNARVLLVDEHPIFRDGLRQAIGRERRLAVVGEAATAAAAVALQAQLAPDLIIMEANLPDLSGLAVAREVLRARPSVKVIILSSVVSRSLVDEALQSGVGGYVWKGAVSGDLLRAIDMVLSGRLYLSPELSAGILEAYRRGLAGEKNAAKPLLSKRDNQLLRLVAGGQRNKEIAVQMAISPKSVEAYRSRLMRKLGCRGAAELIRHAIREGLIAA